ncbi:uncharacterized protein EI97DRAFT_457178 [Westerdykella ornata]|uniref:Mediator of RNA polymerase II transcription subunit 22 n=1 Tax=Westerdykella ornata TaxID=318751 RepID=A0A6A6JMW5_WESOR|nr:uncharacterized protein EI97DRAFT_457178 [Westerdykella ornata]KAF2277941.1 hypothetical protein EI97DRAFT_457178 [Westerdykella ornata]
MDPSKRNAAALHQRIDELCDALVSQYSSIFAAAAKRPDKSAGEIAMNELRIREESGALIRSSQEMATLVRDLQELWLFGGLDTVANPADEEARRERVRSVAAQIEGLVKRGFGAEGRDEGTVDATEGESAS